MKRVMIIFGGKDDEESMARHIARSVGCVLATATVNGKPVHAGNAYYADGFRIDEGSLDSVERVVIFECSPAAAGDLEVIAQCDHHNPGDPGYGLGPKEFMSASSIGQLLEILTLKYGGKMWEKIGWTPCISRFYGRDKGAYCRFLEGDWIVGYDLQDPLLWDSAFTWVIPKEIVLTAADDNCPADAYAGRCPGVQPEEFLAYRIKMIERFYTNHPKLPNKSKEEIFASIQEAKKKLLAAPLVDGVRDLREFGLIDELPDAALSIGEAYMASLPETDRGNNPTGNIKIVLGGHTTPEAVERFMRWGNSLPNRVGDAYGNPIRGFAGVIVES